MEESEIQKIISEIESLLTGDAEQDIEIWNEWGERYRGQPGSEKLLYEIGHRMFELAMEEEGDLPEEIFDDMVETADEDYAEACSLLEQHQYDKALEKLLVLCEVIRNYPLSEDTVWMDFNSYLDALVFQDYYKETIGDREIGRHPMHPAHILFTTGSLLIEMDRAEEAEEILKRLVSYDPVCPAYLFELGEAYKRTEKFGEAVQNALWALSCVSTRTELARGYRDLAYCLTETGAYEDAVILYLMSLNFESSRQAQAEIAWIRKKTGISEDSYNDSSIRHRCEELNIPTGISETVLKNLEFLQMIRGSDEDQAEDNL